jgi:hypothetical protein
METSVVLDTSDFKPRRPYDDDQPDGYMESDRDFVENNFDLCMRLLEKLEKAYAKKKND